MPREYPFVSIAPVIAVSLVLAAGTPSNAQLLVFDSSNYIQNLLTAARALQQIQNQITSLQNEAQMLINEAKHLQQLPASVLHNIERDFSQIQTLLSQGTALLTTCDRSIRPSTKLTPSRSAPGQAISR